MKFIKPTCIECQKIIENPGYIVNMQIQRCDQIRSVSKFLGNIINNRKTYIKLENGKCNVYIDSEGCRYEVTPYKVLRARTMNYDNVFLQEEVMKPEFLEYIYDKFRNHIACSEECCKNSKNKTIRIDIDKIREESDEWEISINDVFNNKFYEGKYKFESFREVYQKDPKYILEAYENLDIFYKYNCEDYKLGFFMLYEIVLKRFDETPKIGLTELLEQKYDDQYMPFGKKRHLSLRNLYHFDKDYFYWMLDNMGLEKLNSYPIMKEFINDIKQYDITELGDYIRDKVRNSGTQFI